MAVMTAGFFAVHGVASGWVAARALLAVCAGLTCWLRRIPALASNR